MKVGDHVSARSVSGTIETIVRRGDRYLAAALRDRRWHGPDFVIVRDANGGAHHVELSEI